MLDYYLYLCRIIGIFLTNPSIETFLTVFCGDEFAKCSKLLYNFFKRFFLIYFILNFLDRYTKLIKRFTSDGSFKQDKSN
jgi:hypothetical protein